MSEVSNPRIQGSNSNQKKNLQIEYIRAIAAIGVVSIHTIYSGILYSGDDTMPYVVLFFTMIKNMLYWAVPCFGMISGILLLNPEKQLSLKKIYGKYLIRIVIVLLLFGTAFSWIEIVFNEHTISLKQIPEAVLMVLKHQTWAHLWYLYALISIYIFLPLWRYVAKVVPSNFLIVIICVLFLFSAIMNSNEISLHMYLFMGELFRRQWIKVSKSKCIFLLILFSIINCIIVYFNEASELNLNRFLGYTSIIVAVFSYILFYYIYSKDFDIYENSLKNILIGLSKNSFGIYLVHMFFVNLEYKILKLHLMNSFASIFVFLVLILANVGLSYIVAMILKKIPYLGKLM